MNALVQIYGDSLAWEREEEYTENGDTITRKIIVEANNWDQTLLCS
jgi:hypothetical protein